MIQTDDDIKTIQKLLSEGTEINKKLKIKIQEDRAAHSRQINQLIAENHDFQEEQKAWKTYTDNSIKNQLNAKNAEYPFLNLMREPNKGDGSQVFDGFYFPKGVESYSIRTIRVTDESVPDWLKAEALKVFNGQAGFGSTESRGFEGSLPYSRYLHQLTLTNVESPFYIYPCRQIAAKSSWGSIMMISDHDTRIVSHLGTINMKAREGMFGKLITSGLYYRWNNHPAVFYVPDNVTVTISFLHPIFTAGKLDEKNLPYAALIRGKNLIF